jgi:hypothetical protein
MRDSMYNVFFICCFLNLKLLGTSEIYIVVSPNQTHPTREEHPAAIHVLVLQEWP